MAIIDDFLEILYEDDSQLDYFINYSLDNSLPFIWHPLGFIVCKIASNNDQNLRLHIWPKNGGKEQEPCWLIHNHIFSFQSWVLNGKVENIEYRLDYNNSEYCIYEASYSKNRSLLSKTNIEVSIHETQRYIVQRGDKYNISASVFHESKSVGNDIAVTVLHTIDSSKNNPRVIGDITGKENYRYERQQLTKEEIRYEIYKI